MRNDCVAALADSFLIPHASVGGKTEALCREVLKAGKAGLDSEPRWQSKPRGAWGKDGNGRQSD